MSKIANSVGGNDGFSKIENSTYHLSELNLTSGRVVDLSAVTVTTRLLNVGIAGLGTLHQVVGYAPTSFATTPTNGVVFLNNEPKAAPATSVSSSQLLLLPSGARVVSAVVTNNGTTVVGGTSFDIGTDVWSSNPSGLSNISAGMLLATVNAGGSVGNLLNAVEPTALGSAGVKLLTDVNAVGDNTGVTVQVLTTNNTAGDLAVTLTYLV
jgi:hypothetical protein